MASDMTLAQYERPSVPISLCICTMDRPEELSRCLASIDASEVWPKEIVVSDDSRGTATRTLCEALPHVRYVIGPRRGQGPNRQTGALACTMPYVSFVDDDAIVRPSFLHIMYNHARDSDGKTIFTGSLYEAGRTMSPTNLTFWGHFGAAVKDRYENVIFASNLFPRRVFDEVEFEPRIKYGYEDSDFCTQALAIGYRIAYVPEACNEHHPSPINRAVSLSKSEYARYYTGLKRYFKIQRRPLAGLAFAVLAPLQSAGGAVRRGRVRTLSRIPTDFLSATLDFLHDWRASSKL